MKGKIKILFDFIPFGHSSQVTLDSLPFNNETSQIPAPPIGFMRYTEGSYLLSPRLTVSEASYKEILPSYKPYLNSVYCNYKMQGVSVGFDYKLVKNASIGTRSNYSNTPGFLNNSFFNSAFDNYIW